MYDSLGEKEIRIFDLQPGQFDDELRCDLRNIELSETEGDTPQYDAISHETGDPNDTAILTCSSERLAIPRTLHTALKHIRSPTDVKTLWAAGVCIDQSNNAEKSSQVRRFGLIYKQARSTLVWVGENSDDVKDAVADLVSWLCPPAMPAGLRPREARINVQLPQGWSEFIDENTTRAGSGTQRWLEDHRQNLDRMIRFMTRTWSTRLWMLQEINSSRAPILLCGSTQVPLVFILPAFAIVSNPHECSTVTLIFLKALQLMGDKDGLSILKTGLQHLANLVHLNLKYDRKPVPLQQLLHLTREYKCSDPRDHLFALSSHAEEFADPNGSPPEIDYSASLETVSKNLSLWFIQQSKHPLWHFGRISRRQSSENFTDGKDFPSWLVPFCNLNDFLYSSFLRAYRIVTHSEKEEPDLAYPLSDYEYNAGLVSENPRPLWNLSSDGNILSMKGRFIGTLEVPDTQPIRGSWRRKRSRAYYQTLFEKILFFDTLLKPGALSAEHARQRVYELITLGREDTTIDAFRGYIAAMNEFVTGRRPDPINDDGLIFPDPVMERVEMAIDQAMDRKFGVMQGMVGWFPMVAEKGDKVCVLYGGRVPYLLRPNGENYQLIGECWVMGKMNGQGLRDSSAEDLFIPLC